MQHDWTNFLSAVSCCWHLVFVQCLKLPKLLANYFFQFISCGDLHLNIILRQKKNTEFLHPNQGWSDVPFQHRSHHIWKLFIIHSANGWHFPLCYCECSGFLRPLLINCCAVRLVCARQLDVYQFFSLGEWEPFEKMKLHFNCSSPTGVNINDSSEDVMLSKAWHRM